MKLLKNLFWKIKKNGVLDSPQPSERLTKCATPYLEPTDEIEFVNLRQKISHPRSDYDT